MAAAELLFVPELVDGRWIDLRLPTLVLTTRLGCGDSFGLAFLAQVGFEFAEYTQHIEEGLPGSGAGVDRLLSRALRRDNQGGFERQSGWMTPGSAAGRA